MASVFFNTYDSTGLHIDESNYTVKATKKDNTVTTYSQVDMARFLLTTTPATTTTTPATTTPATTTPATTTATTTAATTTTTTATTITTGWKRAFEEGLHLLEDDCEKKKARLNRLDSQIKEIMEERQSILVEIQELEKKKRLAKEIFF